MNIFDSHCHLDDQVFEIDFQDVMARSEEANVRRIMIVGIDRTTSHRAVQLAKNDAHLYASVGIHPHEAKACSDETLADLLLLAKETKVVAWGEIGLDFNRMYAPRKDQEKWFTRQLEIAATLDLPLIFHERDSKGRFLEIVKATPDENRSAVVHCFSGNASELAAYLEMGFYIGITGIVTHKKRGQKLRAMVPGIPADRLLVETDAPYLTPSPQRKNYRRNEPAFVRQILIKLAEVRKEDPEELAKKIWENTCKLFRIDTSVPKNHTVANQ